MKVLLDTNFLIDLIRFKVNLDDIADLIGASELMVLGSVERELEKISSNKSKAGMCAKVAIKFIADDNIKTVESEGRPDNAMVKLADDETVVATNDIELRKRLNALGRKTIYLKARKHLAIG